MPRARDLDWIHLEPTTRCQDEIGYYLHSGFRDIWEEHDLEDFGRLAPLLVRTPQVLFQGWGDPLLHPGLPAMVKTAKSAGCRVVVTTPGQVLDRGLAGELVQAGVDYFTFTIAGLDEASNRTRKGTSLARTMEAVRLLDAMRREQDKGVGISMVYTLARSGLDELARMPEFMADLDVDGVVVNLLSFATSRDNDADTLVPSSPEEEAHIRQRLHLATWKLEERGIWWQCVLVGGNSDVFTCIERPASAVFVSASGGLSPCAFSQLPLSEPARYWFQGEARRFPCMHWGDVSDPAGAMASKPWRRLVEMAGAGFTPDPCRDCWRRLMTGL